MYIFLSIKCNEAVVFAKSINTLQTTPAAKSSLCMLFNGTRCKQSQEKQISSCSQLQGSLKRDNVQNASETEDNNRQKRNQVELHICTVCPYMRMPMRIKYSCMISSHLL